MVQSANNVFRDFTIDGVPSSGAHNPKKAEIREWGAYVEQLHAAAQAGGGVVFQTKAAMTLGYAANQIAWVIGDPIAANNGIYQKQGASGAGSWVRLADLPYSFIVASDSGAGEPNAIVATSAIPVTESALILMNVAQTNTASPVTVSFNGGVPLAIKTNSGNDIAVGGLAAAGMLVIGRLSGSTFRLVSDQASSAIIAQAESVLADIHGRYLGALPTDAAATAAAGTPSDGQLYFNSTSAELRVWRGGAWEKAEGEPGPKGDQGLPGVPGPAGPRDTRNFCWAGSFDWWRPRGVSIANTAGRILACDGWTIGRSSSATGVTVTQQQGSRGSNLCARVQRNSGNTGIENIAFVHNLGLDDSRPLIGKKVSVSMRVRGGANFSGASLSCALISGSGLTEQVIALTNGQYSTGNTTVASVAPALTTAWQDVTFTGTVPAGASQVALRINYVPTGTAGAADYFEVEEAQIVLGETAPEFVPVDPVYALMKAQHQFWKTYDDNIAPGTVNYNGSLRVAAVGTTLAKAVQFSASFPQMRATPTITVYSPQTGASGKMAQASTADIDATVTHIGKNGCGISNGAVAVANETYFAHVTAEARL